MRTIVCGLLALTLCSCAHSQRPLSKSPAQKSAEKPTHKFKNSAALKSSNAGTVSKLKPTKALNQVEEQKLYQQLLEAYEQSHTARFDQAFEKLDAQGATGIYRERALYLAGLFALGAKDNAKALKMFNVLLQDYPNSAMVASALYAKGVTLRRMQWNEGAKEQLTEVVNRYKGSPEAERAHLELRILSQEGS